MANEKAISQSDLFHTVYGSTQWGKVKEAFIKELKGAKTNEEIMQVCANLLPYLWYDRPISTVKLRYTDVRNLAREIDGKKGEILLQYFTLPAGIYKMLNDDYQKKVLESFSGDVTITPEILKEVFDKFKEGYDRICDGTYRYTNHSQTPERMKAYYLSVLIAIATGRRQIEVLQTLKILKRGDKIIFDGLAKKDKSDSNIEAPLLFIDVETAKKWLHELRKCLPTETMSTKEVNQKYNNAFNVFLKRETGDENITFHTLRGWYGEVCYQLFANENEDRARFFASVYGQVQTRVSASEAYIGKSRS